MSRRPRVAFLTTASGVGGAERQVASLALGMRSRGWDTAAVSMREPNQVLHELQTVGVETVSLHMPKGVPDPRGLWRLVRWLHDRQPDILHAHMVHANLLARVSRLLHPTPVVICTIHSQHQGARWRYWAYRATDRLTDVTTAVSERARLDALEMETAPADRILTVPNGVDLSVFRDDDGARARLRSQLGIERDFTWLAAGRLTEAKDPRGLIEAFGRVLDSGVEARLLLAGSGDLGEQVASWVADAGIQRQVLLLGSRDDIPDLMRAADAYVMSSAWEGLPLVLLEAAASSLPIVATDVGGNTDVVIDGVTGLVVEPGSPVALATAMMRVQGMSRSQRTALGHAGRRHTSETFGLEAILDRWEHIYGDLLAAKGRPLSRPQDAGRSSGASEVRFETHTH